MKTRHLLTLILLAAILGIAGPAAALAEVEVGAPAPEFTLPDIGGSQHALSNYRDRFVVLEWTNYDCPFVKKHYGSFNMQSLQQDFTARGVIWLSINSSAPGKQGHYAPEEWAWLVPANKAHPTAVLLDASGDVGRLYGAQTTPHMFIINPEGKVVYQGAIDSTPSPNPDDIPTSLNYVRQALEEAMAGQAVSIPQTKAYGCSVKY